MPTAVIYLAAGMLALGAASLPYGYYTLLRIVACAVFAFASYISFSRGARVLPYAYGLLAILFNPIIKVHLPKEVWVVVDLSCAVFLLATARRIRAHG